MSHFGMDPYLMPAPRPRRTLWSRLRRLLSPPRRYYRCSHCHEVVVKRWLAGPPAYPACGVAWEVVPASSLAAQKSRMGAR